MEIANRGKNGGWCHIEFVKTGWMSDARSFGAINGKVFEAEGNSTLRLHGKWMRSVYEDLGRGSQRVLWTVDDSPSTGAWQSYNMTNWAISLNAEVDDNERVVVSPTDGYSRRGQRALENGQKEVGSRLMQVPQAVSRGWTAPPPKSVSLPRRRGERKHAEFMQYLGQARIAIHVCEKCVS